MHQYFRMWYDSKKDVIRAMYKNIIADMDACLDILGSTQRGNRRQLDKYISDLDYDVNWLKTLTEEEREKWCYWDMLRRGVIEREEN